MLSYAVTSAGLNIICVIFFLIGSMLFFFAATRPTHKHLSGFAGLIAANEESEKQIGKRRKPIIQEEWMNYSLNSFPKEIPCLLYWLIKSKKNDNRYEMVQKIDPRNTSRGIKK